MVCQAGNLPIFCHMCEENQIQPDRNHLKAACKGGGIDLVKYLVEAKKIQPDKDNLKEAYKVGNLQIVKYLIEEKRIKPNYRCITNANHSEIENYLKSKMPAKQIGLFSVNNDSEDEFYYI